MNNNLETTDSSLIDTTAAPEATCGTQEQPNEPADTTSLWDRYFPSEVPFFKLALLDQLRHRPYHTVMVEGPLNEKQMAEDYRDHTFRSETIVDRCGNQIIHRLLLRLDDYVFGYLEEDCLKIDAPTPEAAQTVAKQFRRYVKPRGAGKPFFYVISVEDFGPSTAALEIERLAPVTAEDLTLHYGADFLGWEKQWTERLHQVPSGLTIFYGPPGCGKTSYLRALMTRLLNKSVFYYLPVSGVEMLVNPRFVSFWVDQTKRHGKKRKIVLLEDAEELLLPRDIGTRDKVSNLLNLADGFLGDHLKLQVIATTNVPVRELDPAILRPGRLIGSREFRRLTRLEAQHLAAAKGFTLSNQVDFSLAELYCEAAGGPMLQAERPIGFAK